MKLKFNRYIAIAALILGTSRLFAAETGVTPQPSAEVPHSTADTPYTAQELHTARRLLETEGTPAMMEQTLLSTLNTQLAAAPQLLPFRAIFEEYLRNTISYEAMRDELARLYLATYTLPEMEELIAFYETPIGRKKAQSGATLAVALAGITQRKMAENLPEFQLKLQQEVEKQNKIRK